MNMTTLQVLARAIPHFMIRTGLNKSLTDQYNIRTGIDKSLIDPWTVRKTKQCFNCKTIGCNMWRCPHPIDETECNRNRTVFLNTKQPNPIKAPPKKPINVSSRNRDINRHRMAWLESKNKAAWLEEKNDNTLTQLDYRQERYN